MLPSMKNPVHLKYDKVNGSSDLGVSFLLSSRAGILALPEPYSPSFDSKEVSVAQYAVRDATERVHVDLNSWVWHGSLLLGRSSPVQLGQSLFDRLWALLPTDCFCRLSQNSPAELGICPVGIRSVLLGTSVVSRPTSGQTGIPRSMCEPLDLPQIEAEETS